MTHLQNLWARGVVGAFAVAGFLLSADVALAVTDKRAIAGATDVMPAVPEPGAIVLFAAGAALVGWTIRRRRSAE
jgi:hypothetical protein